MTRTEKLLTITQRLIIMTACSLLFVVAMFALKLRHNALLKSFPKRLQMFEGRELVRESAIPQNETRRRAR